MQYADLGQIGLHYSNVGNKDAPCVVLANSLGTDFRLCDLILPLLPKGLRSIRYDKRGHGLSECPDPPYSMAALVKDAEMLLDHIGVKDCILWASRLAV